MKINTIINRYIFKEMLLPFGINLMFFTFIFLMTRIFDITSMMVNHNVGLLSVGLLLVYSTPYFLQYTVPLSVMVTTLVTFLRLSGDNEIVALKAGGMSVFRLLIPVFFICLFGFFLTGLMTVYGLPWGKSSFKRISVELAASSVEIGLKERNFNSSFEGVMMYVSKIDMKTRTLRDIFIEDERNPRVVSTVVAPEGRLFSDPENYTASLRLFNGTVNQVNLETGDVYSTDFQRYDINLDIDRPSVNADVGDKSKHEMSISELRSFLKGKKENDSRYSSYFMKLYEKFSMPAACFALGLLALPLGLSGSSRDKSSGIRTALIFFLLYYILLTIGRSLGESGKLLPIIGTWGPNLIIAGIGVWLLISVARENPVQLPAFPKFTFKNK